MVGGCIEREYFAKILAAQLTDADAVTQATLTLRDGRRFSVAQVLTVFETSTVLLVESSSSAAYQLTVRYDEIATVEVVGAGDSLEGVGVTDEVDGLLASETWSEFRASAEEAYIRRKLAENSWNVSDTARRIDMPRSNRYKKIERYGLGRNE